MFKRIAIVSALVMTFTVLIQAHGTGKHVLGTITAIDGDHVTVKTKDGKEVMVMVDGKTKYTKKKGSASKADLKVGVRVAVDVSEDKDMNMLKASEVRFGSAKGKVKGSGETDQLKTSPHKH